MEVGRPTGCAFTNASGLFCHLGPGFEEVGLLRDRPACRLRAELALTSYKLSVPLPAPRQASVSCTVWGRGASSLTWGPLSSREPPRMTVLPSSLNMVGKPRNFTVDDCFSSRNTVLKGQPFGGIPTVLFLNIILWVVSAGHCGGQTRGVSLGHMVQLSQGIQGPQLSVVVSHQPQRREPTEGQPAQGGPGRVHLGEEGSLGTAKSLILFLAPLSEGPPLASALEPPIWPLDGFFKETSRSLF